jgi:hypothetical protein
MRAGLCRFVGITAEIGIRAGGELGSHSTSSPRLSASTTM